MDKINRIQKLIEMSRLLPNDPFPLYALGLEYFEAKDLQTAETYWTETLQKFPAYLAVYYQFGKLLEEKGDLNQAKTIIEKGMELAREAKDKKTVGELEELLFNLD